MARSDGADVQHLPEYSWLVSLEGLSLIRGRHKRQTSDTPQSLLVMMAGGSFGSWFGSQTAGFKPHVVASAGSVDCFLEGRVLGIITQ